MPKTDNRLGAFDCAPAFSTPDKKKISKEDYKATLTQLQMYAP